MVSHGCNPWRKVMYAIVFGVNFCSRKSQKPSNNNRFKNQANEKKIYLRNSNIRWCRRYQIWVATDCIRGAKKCLQLFLACIFVLKKVKSAAIIIDFENHAKNQQRFFLSLESSVFTTLSKHLFSIFYNN